MKLILDKINIPGAFYGVIIQGDKVIKKRRSNFMLLLNNLLLVDPSIQNAFSILFYPKRKLHEIYLNFELERKIVKDVPVNLIGNICFTENGYTQNYVQLFKDVAITDDLYTKYFTQWVSALKQLWTYGYHDRSMNFDINSGFDAQSNCILFDINEFTNDFQIALDEIRNQKWYKQHPFWKSKFIGKQSLRNKILVIINTECTEIELEKLWNINKKTT
jgi:hypothetical protein